MMKKLEVVLRDLERRLVDLRRASLVASLNVGLRPEQVRDRLSSVGLDSSRELEQLYAWHDGTLLGEATVLDDVHIFPGFYFLSLDEALEHQVSFVGHRSWSAAWFPFMADGGGDFFVVDQANASAVRHFRIEEISHPIEYATLGSFFETEVAAIDSGAIFVDGDGYLEMDDTSYAAVAVRINSDVEWWKA